MIEDYWNTLDKAQKAKTQVSIRTKSGDVLRGHFRMKDSDGKILIYTENRGDVWLNLTEMESIAFLDNLTLFEQIAQEKGLI